MLPCMCYLLPVSLDLTMCLELEEVTFSLKKASWSLRKSKNDQLRKGDEVVISQLSSLACPVKLLKKYLATFKIPPESKDFIFKPISRGKGSCKLVAPDKPISYSTFR